MMQASKARYSNEVRRSKRKFVYEEEQPTQQKRMKKDDHDDERASGNSSEKDYHRTHGMDMQIDGEVMQLSRLSI